MSKVTFKFPFDVQAEDRITGFKGTILCKLEGINGSIQYGLQPRISKEDGTFVPDAKIIDEGYIQLIDAEPAENTVDFKFETGQKVRSIVNGFEGIITCRKQWLNGCLQYTVEGKMVKSDLHGLIAKTEACWEQELEAVVDAKTKETAKVDVPNRKRTGGPSGTLKTVETL